MAHLSLSLLGSFQACLDGQPVTGFKSNKERALLAYLAVEADRPHRREVLAGLLWPDWPDRDALSNLRYALSNLRQVIGDRTAEPPFLLVTRDTLQFDRDSDCALDVRVLSQAVEIDKADPPDVERLEEAVALYQGAFLEGFSLGDSPPFEEWTLLTRERLARVLSGALHRLAATCEQRGDYEQARRWAWRQIELEPWDEAAHQQLMRALGLSGRRSAALAQYEACRGQLAEELGVEPSAETTRLYEQIRDGSLRAATAKPTAAASEPQPGPRSPAFLEEAAPQVERSIFVAREGELAQLREYLDLALGGHGQVVFVTGEAGSGKTSLLQEFGRRAQNRRGDLVVAGGDCSAYTGIGDPYLPFRELLGLLTGDVEARWAAGAIEREHARRLWLTFPLAVQALAEAGPDLVGTFVPRSALLERTATCVPDKADWLSHRLEASREMPATDLSARGMQQTDLFEQYTRVLQALANRAPLLLVLDDLQWADLGSISMLFHLGRRLAGSRILVVGAYRPEEVALGRDGARHPLEPVVNELQRDLGRITVSLGQAESREFADALLDAEPNRFGVAFREMLYRQTGGQPLFTIELLRGLQERGDLAQDAEGRWVEGPALDWETLPARVEAVIAERIGRLAEPLQAALRVACVEGEVFTAEVLARVRATAEPEMSGLLSSELDRKHRVIRAQSIQRMNGQLLSSYRFRHILFQRYLYRIQDEVERVHLHEQVGTALEKLYGGQERAAPIAVTLALHFQKARITRKAVHYLQLAGERAVQLSAYEEAVAHLTRGLELLMAEPDSPERRRQELALQETLGLARIGPEGYGPETQKAFTRAQELCRQVGKVSQLSRVVGQLATSKYVAADYQRARELAEEALNMAEREGEPVICTLGHWRLGFILFALGEYAEARAHLEQVIDFYQPQQHHRLFVSLHGADAGLSALSYAACYLWCLGYPQQALTRSREALAVARELDHPFSLADVLSYAGCMFHSMRRDALRLKEDSVQLIRLSMERGLAGWRNLGTRCLGEALVMSERFEEGIAQIREGMAGTYSDPAKLYLAGTLCHLGEAEGKAGDLEQGLSTLAEGLALVERTAEHHWEAELHRQRGELLLMQRDEAEAEASFHKAIEVARHQQAKSWELRATTGLARLWQGQGRTNEARQALAEIYDWFREGFDTPDLREAASLLEELSQP
jgi:DNA-binding SARP family transcriptional activator/predicted ATPase/energy-coupling factor transporter ATP-binding protein EcfA2